jgi:putative ABC transport system permease protein
VFIDVSGAARLFPQGGAVGTRLELNDQRAVIRGIVETDPSFTATVILYTRYSNALNYVPGSRNRLSFVLARAAPSRSAKEVAQSIEQATGLRARTSDEFAGDGIQFIIDNTGIPINFGITVALGFIVGGAAGSLDFKGFYTPWQIPLITAVVTLVMILLTGLVALRSVLRTEPAEVFR